MSIIDVAPPQAARLLPLLRQVHELHVDRQPERYPPLPEDTKSVTWLSGWISAANVCALGFEVSDTLVGYVIYEIEDRPASPVRRAETRAMLHHICVDSAHRQQGIAAALIHEMRRRLNSSAVPVVATAYASFNTTSAALMQSVGFSPVMTVAEWRR